MAKKNVRTDPVVYGKIIQIFTSPALTADEETDRINVVVQFNKETTKAIYTDEEDEIAGLTTQKGYGVYFNTKDNGKVTFLVDGVETTGYLHFSSMSIDDTEIVYATLDGNNLRISGANTKEQTGSNLDIK